MKTKRLKIIESPDQNAAILVPQVLPLFKGGGDENLLCGQCSSILCESVSEQFFADRFSSPSQLLIKCPTCGKHNYLRAKVGH